MKSTSPLLINESPLQVLPSLATKIGLNEAILVQQVHYWLRFSDNEETDQDGIERKWTYKTLAEWEEEFPFWSASTIRRTIKSAHEQGVLVVEKKRRHKGDQTNWYSVNYVVLNAVHSGNGGVSGDGEAPNEDKEPNPPEMQPAGAPDASTREQPKAAKPTREAFVEAYGDLPWGETEDFGSWEAVRSAPPVAMMSDPQWQGYFSQYLRSSQHYQLGQVAHAVDDLHAWYSVLDYWASNGLQARSTGKMRDRYRRIQAGELPRYNGNGFSYEKGGSQQGSVSVNEEGHITYVPTASDLEEMSTLVIEAARDLCKRSDSVSMQDFSGYISTSATRHLPQHQREYAVVRYDPI